MGVRGLQSYMEKSCPEGCHKVVIKDLIEIYRRETGREPVIVVDANSCLRHLYGKLDWVQGGQLTQYVEKGRHLVRQFERLGARLVMFFDGATVARKRATWVERRLRSLEDVYRVFDALEPAGDPAAVPDRLFQLPPELAQMSRGLFKLLCGCEVRNSIKECDEEIVEYAQRHGCFAILGQDTDYVIYGGAQYYLSMLHLDVDAMTTYNYSRWALARHLRISPDHLPMLASLIGNDLISTTDLKEFHQRLSGSYSPNLHMVIEKVAGFVRTLPTGPPMMASVPGVAHSVFGDQRWAPQLETSVRSYHVDASRPEGGRLTRREGADARGPLGAGGGAGAGAARGGRRPSPAAGGNDGPALRAEHRPGGLPPARPAPGGDGPARPAPARLRPAAARAARGWPARRRGVVHGGARQPAPARRRGRPARPRLPPGAAGAVGGPLGRPAGRALGAVHGGRVCAPALRPLPPAAAAPRGARRRPALLARRAAHARDAGLGGGRARGAGRAGGRLQPGVPGAAPQPCGRARSPSRHLVPAGHPHRRLPAGDLWLPRRRAADYAVAVLRWETFPSCVSSGQVWSQ
ncbi:uncharacterized protein LOC134542196 isoform X2 [Bacillus rossius redtenbacheri]|uniref:uncharacterized protein LOC134542196 isoform X2 n=1 Tax=Bacillus rossius redtenbacheri TaxID=93214 RepID=UPI002FDEE737